MALKSNDLIEEYYELVREEHPTITLEQFKEICNAPWRYARKEMEIGELPVIRMKYFGTFQVHEGRAKNMLHTLKNRFKLHKIDPKQYFRLKEMLEKFLNKDE